MSFWVYNKARHDKRWNIIPVINRWIEKLVENEAYPADLGHELLPV